MSVRKYVHPWYLMEDMVKVKFIDVQALYEKTSSSSGLVHAVAGPILVDDRYSVHLGPIGRQGARATTSYSTLRRK